MSIESSLGLLPVLRLGWLRLGLMALVLSGSTALAQGSSEAKPPAGQAAVQAVGKATTPEVLHFGVLAFRPKPETIQRWQPLVDYLNRAGINRKIVLEALDYKELNESVSRKHADIVLTQPAHYIELSNQQGLYSPLATMVGREGNMAAPNYGGVILTLANRQDIQTLSNLRGKRIAVPDKVSFAGYLAQAAELKKIGLSIPQDVEIVTTGMPHDNVIQMVLSGKADAGFVRTGVIEGMVKVGKLDVAKLRILRATHTPPYPIALSTSLYPEWALAAMPWVDETIARQIAAAILALPHSGEIAKAAQIEGFTIPGNYRNVEEVMREFRVAPFDKTPDFTLRDFWERYSLLIGFATAALSLVLAVLLAALVRSHVALRKEHAQFEQLAQTDSLTGLVNRRHFLQLAQGELERAYRYQGALSFLMMDIDHFKNINDTYGHQTGDVVLQALANVCSLSLRDVDVMSRFGGEEFAVMLPLTNLAQATEACERLRAAVEKIAIPLEHGLPIHVTVSIGVTTLGDSRANMDTLLGQADSALYEAKRQGRNRVCVYAAS